MSSEDERRQSIRRIHRFTEETEVTVEPATIADVHLEDLSFVLDVTHDGDDVASCTLDLARLIELTALHSSLEIQRYGWRR